jgi:asparagine synthase (glutamine-hydrolysing)
MRFEYLRRGSTNEELFWGGAIAFGEESKRNLLSESYLGRVSGLNSHDVVLSHRRRFDQRSIAPDYLGWMSYLDLKMRLPELLLMRVDKMTMATSVEARVPFLDHEFVGLAMSMSQQQRLNGYRQKYILKEAVRGLIPDDIIGRPKQGFQVPVSQWLTESLGPMAANKLRDFCSRTDYFSWPRVKLLLEKQDARVWYLLNLVLWHELWIEETGLTYE